MSVPDECPLPCGGGRVLMLGTVVLATAAATVLAAGARDADLLRLGLVAALWAALLGAFAMARMRREISSGASRADQLRAAYQLELEREVVARREHTLTVERELREQTTRLERREIAALRAELVAIRATLEELSGGNPPGERVVRRAEPARLVSMPTQPRKDPASRHDNGGGTQRSVNDLLAAHGTGSPPRRRRSREDGPQAATGA